MNNYEKFIKYQKEISNLQYAINILCWELKVSAPLKSKEDLLNLINNFETKLFKLQTSKKYDTLLCNLINSEEFKKLEEKEQIFIKNLKLNLDKNSKIPANFYKKYNNEKHKSCMAWEKAKEKNDYKIFKPHLKLIIEMTKEYYRYFHSNEKDLYNTLLNDYEKGINTKLIDKWFEELKKEIIPIIEKYKNAEIKKLNYNYTEEELKKCAEYLLNYIGFDLNRGSVGVYPHGFSEKMGENDVRIAFKLSTDPIEFVSTVIHEGGHGIFEQNVSKKLLKYESLALDNIYALHESQSRFFENILGRNINFWIPIYEDIKKLLYLDISIDEFVKLLNFSKPNKIRVESDELTYCMHIILRYEIEKEIFDGKIDVDDLPKIWNEKVKKYLGLKIETDSEGLMQDMHWSEGSFGYFPTYLLGSIYDGLFKEIIEDKLGNIDEILKSGNIKKITKFLIENIYINGNIYSGAEILKILGKKKIDVKPFIKYLKSKY